MSFYSKLGRYAGRAAYKLAGYGIRKIGRAGVKWAARRFFGANKNAKRGTAGITVRIPSHVDLGFTFDSNDKYSHIYRFQPFDFSTDGSNFFASLTNQRAFKHYVELYDECRLLGVKYKWTLNNGLLASGSFMSFVSAWDRNYGPEDSKEAIDHNEMMNSPGVMKSTFTNQSRGQAYRGIYARTLLERQTYFDCTIHRTAGGVDYVPGYEKMVTGFRPALICMMHKGTAQSGETSIAARLEIEYVVRFRNPKYQEIDENDRSLGYSLVPADVTRRKTTADSVKQALAKMSPDELKGLIEEAEEKGESTQKMDDQGDDLT